MANNKNVKKTNGKNKIDIQKMIEFKMKFNIKNIFIFLFIAFFFIYAFRSISSEFKKAIPEKSITALVKDVKDKKITKVEVYDNRIIAYYKGDKLALSYKESSDSFIKTLRDSGINPETINIIVKDTQGSNGLVNLLSNIVPTILMVAFFIFLFRQAKGAQDSVFSFGLAKYNRFSKVMAKTTFYAVAGVEEAIKELE